MELSERCYVIIEYGIESVFDRTLQRVNRGHDVEKDLMGRKGDRGPGHPCGRPHDRGPAR